MQNHYRRHHNHFCHYHRRHYHCYRHQLAFFCGIFHILWYISKPEIFSASSLMSYSNFSHQRLIPNPILDSHIYAHEINRCFWFCIGGSLIYPLKLFMLMVSSLNSKFDLFHSFCPISKYWLIPWRPFNSVEIFKKILLYIVFLIFPWPTKSWRMKRLS